MTLPGPLSAVSGATCSGPAPSESIETVENARAGQLGLSSNGMLGLRRSRVLPYCISRDKVYICIRTVPGFRCLGLLEDKPRSSCHDQRVQKNMQSCKHICLIRVSSGALASPEAPGVGGEPVLPFLPFSPLLFPLPSALS